MASSSPVPAKSRTLHNFKLPQQLNWHSDHASNHVRRRRSTSSPPANWMAQRQRRLSQLFASAPPLESPLRRSVSESDASDDEKKSSPETAKARVSDNFRDRKIGKSPGKWIGKSEGWDAGGSGLKKGKAKVNIRFRSEDKHEDHMEGKGKTGTDELELEEAKTWNLRPRKPIRKQPNANVGTAKAGGSAESPVQAESAKPPNCGGADEAAAAAVEEKKKPKMMMIPKFSLTLTRLEIEEDIYAMTGRTPARKPPKREKHVQKQLDNLFPGKWLDSVSPEAYKVSGRNKGSSK